MLHIDVATVVLLYTVAFTTISLGLMVLTFTAAGIKETW